MPLTILGILSALTLLFDWDRTIASGFYAPDEGWFLAQNRWIQIINDYGTWPAVGVSVLAGATVILGWLRPKLVPRKNPALLLVLLLVVGPGLVVNMILKDHFGRPRPNQTGMFDGDRSFQELFQPNFAVPGKSFPCGHASMGFFWLGLFAYYHGRGNRLARMFLVLGLVHGSILGFARIVKGAHWASDVLWSAGCVYLSGWALCRILDRFAEPTAGTNPPVIGVEARRPTNRLATEPGFSVIVPFCNQVTDSEEPCSADRLVR